MDDFNTLILTIAYPCSYISGKPSFADHNEPASVFSIVVLRLECMQ